MEEGPIRSRDGSRITNGGLGSLGAGERAAAKRRGRGGTGAEPAGPAERELAHDLAEALGTISLFADSLQSRLDHVTDRDAVRDLAGIRAGLERVNKLLAATLDPGGPTGNRAEHRPVDTDLVVREARANVAARAEGAGAKIVSEPLPWVRGDGPSLVRLFQNLLANAIEHRDPQRPPRIRIGARPRGDVWLFEVADNGTGLAAGPLEGGPARDGGRGLGIGICARIVAAHGGAISAAPRAEGGTTVSFELPRAER